MNKILPIVFAIIFLISYFFGERIFTTNTIIFGASVPKTGLMKEWGKNVEVGINSYFQYANDKNILPNYEKIKLIAFDDKYEPDLTMQNTEKLINNNELFGFFGYVGTPTVKKILPFLEKESIPFIAPFTGASFLRQKGRDNIVNFRASYFEEIDAIVEYLNKKKGIKRFSIFYQNDDYGEEGYVSLIKSLRTKGLKLNGEGMYKRNTLSIKHAFSEIKESKPEAIIMIGAYKPNAIFIKKAREDEVLKDVIFCNISFGDANAMIKELDYEPENLIFSGVVPNFNSQNIDVIKEYRYIMGRYYPNQPLSFISLEAFLAAKSVVSAIKNIEGRLTHSKFLYELKNLSYDSLKGLRLEYKNTQLFNKVYLFEYDDFEFKEIEYEN